jgi:hypothetical protein
MGALMIVPQVVYATIKHEWMVVAGAVPIFALVLVDLHFRKRSKGGSAPQQKQA